MAFKLVVIQKLLNIGITRIMNGQSLRVLMADPEENKKDRLLILVPKNNVSKRYIISPAKYVSNIFCRLQLLMMYQDAKGKPYSKKNSVENLNQ